MFRVEQQADAVIVHAMCDLDFLSRGDFYAVLDTACEKSAPRIVVSLLDCNYADSTALNGLARAYLKVGDRLALVMEPGATVRRAFEITDFQKLVPIYPTVEDALGSL